MQPGAINSCCGPSEATWIHHKVHCHIVRSGFNPAFLALRSFFVKGSIYQCPFLVQHNRYSYWSLGIKPSQVERTGDLLTGEASPLKQITLTHCKKTVRTMQLLHLSVSGIRKAIANDVFKNCSSGMNNEQVKCFLKLLLLMDFETVTATVDLYKFYHYMRICCI